MFSCPSPLMWVLDQPLDHNNVEARSRRLVPVSAQIYRVLILDLFSLLTLNQLFNWTVALVKLTIRNTAESIISGRMTTKGRVEYHFLVFGRLAFLVLEVKFELGIGQELDAIAQIVAECHGIYTLHLPHN